MGSFGPALVLTFDNLGEASVVERGQWPADEPLGRHPSVTVALPRLLDELESHGLAATFFVEACNCELYPDAVLEIAARGHEVGMHGWRHEQWSALPEDRERALLARGIEAFERLGIAVRGFRPPGGELTRASTGLMREAGIEWCSPAGGPLGLRDGLVFVPFEWELVDAYHLMARFGPLRSARGGLAEPVPASVVARQFVSAVAGLRGPRTLILHPFLMLDEEWWRGVRELLAAIAGAGVRVVSGGWFAASYLLGVPECLGR